MSFWRPFSDNLGSFKGRRLLKSSKHENISLDVEGYKEDTRAISRNRSPWSEGIPLCGLDFDNQVPWVGHDSKSQLGLSQPSEADAAHMIVLCVVLRELNDMGAMLGQWAGDSPPAPVLIHTRMWYHKSYLGTPRLSFLILQWRARNDGFLRFLQAPWTTWDNGIQGRVGGPTCTTTSAM